MQNAVHNNFAYSVLQVTREYETTLNKIRMKEKFFFTTEIKKNGDLLSSLVFGLLHFFYPIEIELKLYALYDIYIRVICFICKR